MNFLATAVGNSLDVHQTRLSVPTNMLFQMGVFQERYESLFSQLVRFDFDVIDEMKGFIDPFDNSLKILSEAANS